MKIEMIALMLLLFVPATLFAVDDTWEECTQCSTDNQLQKRLQDCYPGQSEEIVGDISLGNAIPACYCLNANMDIYGLSKVSKDKNTRYNRLVASKLWDLKILPGTLQNLKSIKRELNSYGIKCPANIVSVLDAKSCNANSEIKKSISEALSTTEKVEKYGDTSDRTKAYFRDLFNAISERGIATYRKPVQKTGRRKKRIVDFILALSGNDKKKDEISQNEGLYKTFLALSSDNERINNTLLSDLIVEKAIIYKIAQKRKHIRNGKTTDPEMQALGSRIKAECPRTPQKDMDKQIGCLKNVILTFVGEQVSASIKSNVDNSDHSEVIKLLKQKQPEIAKSTGDEFDQQKNAILSHLISSPKLTDLFYEIKSAGDFEKKFENIYQESLALAKCDQLAGLIDNICPIPSDKEIISKNINFTDFGILADVAKDLPFDDKLNVHFNQCEILMTNMCSSPIGGMSSIRQQILYGDEINSENDRRRKREEQFEQLCKMPRKFFDASDYKSANGAYMQLLEVSNGLRPTNEEFWSNPLGSIINSDTESETLRPSDASIYGIIDDIIGEEEKAIAHEKDNVKIDSKIISDDVPLPSSASSDKKDAVIRPGNREATTGHDDPTGMDGQNSNTLGNNGFPAPSSTNSGAPVYSASSHAEKSSENLGAQSETIVPTTVNISEIMKKSMEAIAAKERKIKQLQSEVEELRNSDREKKDRRTQDEIDKKLKALKKEREKLEQLKDEQKRIDQIKQESSANQPNTQTGIAGASAINNPDSRGKEDRPSTFADYSTPGGQVANGAIVTDETYGILRNDDRIATPDFSLISLDVFRPVTLNGSPEELDAEASKALYEKYGQYISTNVLDEKGQVVSIKIWEATPIGENQYAYHLVDVRVVNKNGKSIAPEKSANNSAKNGNKAETKPRRFKVQNLIETIDGARH